MGHPRLRHVASRKKSNPFAYRPRVERIEERLLPGEGLLTFLMSGMLAPEQLPASNPMPDETPARMAGLPQESSATPSSMVTFSPDTSSLTAATIVASANAVASARTSSTLPDVMNAESAAPPAQPGAFQWSEALASSLVSSARHQQFGQQIESRGGSQIGHAPIFQGSDAATARAHAEQRYRENQIVADAPLGAQWSSYGHDEQHSGISGNASVPLTGIQWQTPVDLARPSGEILIHYASTLITANNTAIVAVRTSASNTYRVDGRSGYDGSLMWSVTTDFVDASPGWVSPLPEVLDPNGRLYVAGAGGKIYSMDNPDQIGATFTGTQAFYGISNYNTGLNSHIFINTPLTSDSSGNIYFGFKISGSALNLANGIAEMAPNGSGFWTSAQAAVGDTSRSYTVAQSSAPAISNDESTVYALFASSFTGPSYLVALDTATLTPQARVRLFDPHSGQPAYIESSSTASPLVGPDGDVYIGILENPFPSNNDRGWLLHFSSDLSTQLTPGAFGWDDTASIVPSYLVPSYAGSSAYLIMSKYNNYAGVGSGDGTNKIAILDPDNTEIDPITGATVMNEVMTVLGQTRDPQFPQYPNAVREWCINAAAVDPFTDSVLVNSEDGGLYRWDLTTGNLTETVHLAPATSEAYTSTAIGPDGKVYAVNDAILFAVG